MFLREIKICIVIIQTVNAILLILFRALLRIIRCVSCGNGLANVRYVSVCVCVAVWASVRGSHCQLLRAYLSARFSAGPRTGACD